MIILITPIFLFESIDLKVWIKCKDIPLGELRKNSQVQAFRIPSNHQSAHLRNWLSNTQSAVQVTLPQVIRCMPWLSTIIEPFFPHQQLYIELQRITFVAHVSSSCGISSPNNPISVGGKLTWKLLMLSNLNVYLGGDNLDLRCGVFPLVFLDIFYQHLT